MSHPMRVRGLKLFLFLRLLPTIGPSHPMRVRGLKRKSHFLLNRFETVAPHAGAWIETYCSKYAVKSYGVAPHAGAWIETNK